MNSEAMNVQARLLDDEITPAIWETIKEYGLEWTRVSTGGIVVDLGETDFGGKHFCLPESLGNRLTIKATERGGNNEILILYSSRIVCGLEGEKLRPYLINTKCQSGDHAYFSFPKLVTVSSNGGGKTVLIEKHHIEKESDKAVIVTDLLGEIKVKWIGNRVVLDGELKKFGAAAYKAIIKANCRGCKHVHYAIMPKKTDK
jgi:hypothetical protein